MDRRYKYSNKDPIKNKGLLLDIKFDINELDLMCQYIISENRIINRGGIINLRNLFLIIDMSLYSDSERKIRIDFIMRGIEARLDYNLSRTDMIISHIYGGLGNCPSNFNRELNNSEVIWVNQTVSEILKYSIIYNDVDKGLALFTKFKATDYANRGPIVSEIEEYIINMHNKFRRSKAEDASEIMFSLSGDRYLQSMQNTYRQLSSPANRLIFGCQALNALTGGGVESERVYTILGLPGEGKSATLLEMAIQIKKYNKNYVCKDPTKKPCVVLLVMENSIKETVQRIFNMCVGKDMLEFTEEEIYNALKTQGGLFVSDQDPIDIIIKYRPNLSEDTSYLYTLTEDLEDEGYEVICMIQDYIKRIRSVEGTFGGDLRAQLGAIINEFKVFATLKQIPVITASQLNRVATQTIDEARIKNKADLVRLIGRSNVGESNLIIENSDWIGLIAPEYDRNGVKYLGIQKVKSRYFIPGDFHVAYLPYIGTSIKLIEDLYSNVPVYKVTLKGDEVPNGGINSGNGVVSEIKNFVDFNNVKLPQDPNNIFINANKTIAYQLDKCNYIGNGNNKTMCKIINKRVAI